MCRRLTYVRDVNVLQKGYSVEFTNASFLSAWKMKKFNVHLQYAVNASVWRKEASKATSQSDQLGVGTSLHSDRPKRWPLTNVLNFFKSLLYLTFSILVCSFDWSTTPVLTNKIIQILFCSQLSYDFKDVYLFELI